MNINEIARRAGVAKSTVSNVLTKRRYVSPETTAKVLKACEELNYVPNYFASNILNAETNIIGLFLEIGNNDYYSYYNELFEGCVTQASNLEKQILIYFSPNKDSITTELGQGKSPLAGAILLAPYQIDSRISELEKKHIPYVTIGTMSKDNTSFSVDVKNEEAVKFILKHLIDYGHRSILFINSMKDLEITNERDNAIKELLKEYKDLKVITRYTEDKENRAVSIIESIDDNYSVILTSSDILAKDLYEYYQNKNIVIGRDISIASLGGTKYSDTLVPKLTSMTQNYVQLGSESVKMLVDVMENKIKKSTHKYFECEIIYGESVRNLKEKINLKKKGR